MLSVACVYCIVLYLGTLQLRQICVGLQYTDAQDQIDKNQQESDSDINQHDTYHKSTSGRKSKQGRRYWLVTSNLNLKTAEKFAETNEDDKDERLKSKITTLVEQTLHDTNRKISIVENLKEQHRHEAPYRAGFILSMIKKSKDVLSELFNVAVKHKNDWKALEQLKIFELIVHTNVDTTNLVRQLVEIHIQHMNATNSEDNKKRVVLIK